MGDRLTDAEIETPARSGILVGACGFSYDEWEGFVFPPGLPKTERLTRYAEHFRLVELDSTYYGTPRADRVARWADQTPEEFVFTAKVPKQVTQQARLQGPLALGELERFLTTMRLLGPRLGPLVFQMSPGFRYPRDFKALHTALEALPSLGGDGLRFAIEFRHPSWLERDEPAGLLRSHRVAWVWNDWLPTEAYLAPMPRAIDDPRAQPVTADDFAYVRLIGNHAECIDYRSITVDRLDDLVRWAELALEFRRGREARGVYILLNNHYSGSSPATIRELERRLGLDVEPFGSPDLGHDLASSINAAHPGDAVGPAHQAPLPSGQARLPGF
ncbi:MAG: hypothetical protein AVDCRST_MAG77-5744 [uncultured Chloroflexi bacterium]|uniref:DUF72 domain-containing protein n=1 Tax=uncultured Chloroflexota bacterium TaxID=166587 RepID=A0A6J4KCQ4_9CHLR|nr:MAG: hypothetical protein AVDCRST_MAG77-5744 [uncultured Chloroflexota bacterium]